MENTTYTYVLLKSWKVSKSLVDLSPTRRQLKNNRLERVKIKSDEVDFKLCGIASTGNSSY